MIRGRLIARLGLLAAAIVLWLTGGTFSGIGAILSVVAFVLVVWALTTGFAAHEAPPPSAADDGDLRRLVAAAKSGDPHNSVIAIGLLGDSGSAEAVGPLIRSLRSRSYADRTAAVMALGKTRDPLAVPHIVDTLLRPISSRERHATGAFMEIRNTHRACIDALASFETVEAVDALESYVAVNATDRSLASEVAMARAALESILALP